MEKSLVIQSLFSSSSAFFSQIVGIYMYARCGHTLNDAVMNIGRSLVTEESINDAQAKAKKGLEKYMGDTQIMPLNEMSISVDYASGSKKEWTKRQIRTCRDKQRL